MTATHCSLDGCSKPTYCRGMCCAHYAKWRKARPAGAARPRPAVPDSDPTLTVRISLREFMAGMAAACPPLPGASCRRHVELFDRTIWDHRRKKETLRARTAAVLVCNECPALRDCRAWLDSMPIEQRPTGVVAGRIINAKQEISPHNPKGPTT